MNLIVVTEALPTIESSSEFLAECSNMNIIDLLEIMDKIMNEMEILFPKKYEMILQEMENSKKFLTNSSRKS